MDFLFGNLLLPVFSMRFFSEIVFGIKDLGFLKWAMVYYQKNYPKKDFYVLFSFVILCASSLIMFIALSIIVGFQVCLPPMCNNVILS